MEITTKIAVVTDDGERISDHFGRAMFYQVFSVVNGKIAGSEMRNRRGTLHHGKEHDHHDHGGGDHQHGFQQGAADRHSAMIGQIMDVSLLITRGMGRGAYAALAEAGIQTAATNLTGTEEAVQAFLAGTLTVEEGRIH